MLRKFRLPKSLIFFFTKRNFCSNGLSNQLKEQPLKVTICGAAGQVGRTVSFLLKQSSHNLDISLFDITPNLIHLSRQLTLINTKNTVDSTYGPIKLKQALKGADIVTILVKAKSNNKTILPDSFDANFIPVGNIAKCFLEVCPDAILLIGTEPLNSLVPAVHEIFKYYGHNNAEKIIGLTSMDAIQAGIVYASKYKLDPSDVFVPISGGTSVDTIVPIFSEGSPGPRELVDRDHSEKLHNKFLLHKNLESTSEMASAYAIIKFFESLIRAMRGEQDIVETGFVLAPEGAPAKYMTSLIDLGENGIQNVYRPPISLNRYEKRLMQTAITNLQRDISIAEKYAFTARKMEQKLR